LTLRDLRNISEKMPFNKLIGIRVVRRHPDGVTIDCPMTDQLRNGAGVMHGGVMATLADVAVGVGLASHFGRRYPITTTDIKINYLRPIADGKIVARSHVLRVGKRLCVGRVDMFDTKRQLVAAAIVTYILLE
jgi:acyl-CoA thioesterase